MSALPRIGAASIAFVSAVALAQPPGRPLAAKAKPGAPASRYASYVQRWHAASDEPAVVDDEGRPELLLVSLNGGARAALRATGDRGGFSASDLDRAAIVLEDTRLGNAHPVEPRLLDLAYDIERHFLAHELRVISGYRTPARKGGSNHGKGRAMDFVVPGTSDENVAEYARTLGFVGVGIYPTSGFVHLDVRERSYFWRDASGPGKRNRERGILGDLAAASDKEAIARGTKPPAPFTLVFDVDAVLRARGVGPDLAPRVGGASARPASADDEEDDDDAPGGS